MSPAKLTHPRRLMPVAALLNATLVVYGQYQVIGNEAHITGQILDVKTEKSCGSFSATGQMNNLFPLERFGRGTQLLRALAAGMVDGCTCRRKIKTLAESRSPPLRLPPRSLLLHLRNTIPTLIPDYASPGSTYSYDYGPYPYYWYSVPYYGPDIWFFGDSDFYHHHYWNHGWNGWHGHEGDHGIAHGSAHSPGVHSGGGSGSHGASGGSHGR